MLKPKIKYAVTDPRTGEEKLYDYFEEYCKYIKVGINEKYGIIDDDMKELFPITYQEIYGFNPRGIAVIKKDDRLGIINKKCEVVHDCIFDELLDTDDYRFIIVSKEGKYGILDSTGKFICDCIYEKIGQIHNDYADVCLDGKWGYVNYEGKLVIECQFDKTSSFESSQSRLLATVIKNEESFTIDVKGNRVD